MLIRFLKISHERKGMLSLTFPSVVFQTALHLAVITEQPDLVDALLKAGCDPQLVDDCGNTALHIACKKGSLHCFSVLTQYRPQHLASILATPNYSGRFTFRTSAWQWWPSVSWPGPCPWTGALSARYRSQLPTHSFHLRFPVTGRKPHRARGGCQCTGGCLLHHLLLRLKVLARWQEVVGKTARPHMHFTLLPPPRSTVTAERHSTWPWICRTSSWWSSSWPRVPTLTVWRTVVTPPTTWPTGGRTPRYGNSCTRSLRRI